MTQTLHIDPRLFVRDMAVGLAMFSLLMFAIIGASSSAGAVEANIIAFAEGRALPMLLISGLFALALAFNLALYRHARRAYSPVRRRSRQSDASIPS